MDILGEDIMSRGADGGPGNSFVSCNCNLFWEFTLKLCTRFRVAQCGEGFGKEDTKRTSLWFILF